MERFYKNLVGTHIYRDDGKRPITTVEDIVIDPENGKMLAVVVNRNKVIAVRDIISWGDIVKIHDPRDIVDSDEILRVENVLNSRIKIVGSRVVSEDGSFLGKVIDYCINGDTLSLKKLYVSKSFLGMVRYGGRVILAKHIVEILPKKIVVKNNVAGVKQEAKSQGVVKEATAG